MMRRDTEPREASKRSCIQEHTAQAQTKNKNISKNPINPSKPDRDTDTKEGED